MRKKILSLAIAYLLLSTTAFAQELLATVVIDNQQTPNLPAPVLENLKQSIVNFINTRRWTDDQFKPEERIKFNLQITLLSSSQLGSYKCIAEIQPVRPIYNTTYESPLYKFIDKDFEFEFAQGQPLDFNENIFVNNLVSMLSFYCYVVLATDYDTFGKLSGTKFIEKAYNIANIAQQSAEGAGWRQNEFNNRWALIKDLNNQQFTAMREAFYIYHFQALDKFENNPDEARKKIFESLQKIKTVQTLNPISVFIRSFFQGKRDELIKIFSKADDNMKNQVVKLLRELDGANGEKYNDILINR
ncbi:MAG: DUF4835 family protein [Cytophagaceae bacterium]|nr:DUF4835 family protein [Cytophagaceae bacterium]MDW8457345.1 DUF4835 family protein [Cytophagaceae bacterium]